MSKKTKRDIMANTKEIAMAIIAAYAEQGFDAWPDYEMTAADQDFVLDHVETGRCPVSACEAVEHMVRQGPEADL